MYRNYQKEKVLLSEKMREKEKKQLSTKKMKSNLSKLSTLVQMDYYMQKDKN